MNADEILQIAGILSVASSTAVVLTLILFQPLRSKLFMRIIAWISLCDAVANCTYLTAYRPSSEHWWCTASAVLNLYFYPVSWFWTCVLVFFLYSLAISKRLPISELGIHTICWGIPLIFFALNFIFTSINHPDNYQFGVCQGDTSNRAFYYYHLVTYNCLLLFCDLLMMYLYWRIHRVKASLSEEKSAVLTLAIDVVWMYPASFSVCWLPLVIVIFLQIWFPGAFADFAVFAAVCKVLQGSVTAIIFFYKSAEARQRWRRLFFWLIGWKTLSSSRYPRVLSVDIEADRSSAISRTQSVSPVDIAKEGAVEIDFSVDSNAVLSSESANPLTFFDTLWQSRAADPPYPLSTPPHDASAMVENPLSNIGRPSRISEEDQFME